jgi:hypothetical protein
MTVQSIDVEVDHVNFESSAHSDVSEQEESFLPRWVTEQRNGWGEKLIVPEWEDNDGKYRDTHGWKVGYVETERVEDLIFVPSSFFFISFTNIVYFLPMF